MIPQENSALTVIHIDQNNQKNKNIEKYDYETTIRDQEAINLVAELRAKIDAKEAEMTRLREALQRDDEVSFPEMLDKLKKLQLAFENVQRMCLNKITPIELEYNRVCAQLEGKNNQITSLGKEAGERIQSIDRINKQACDAIAKLDDPKVNFVNEEPLYPIYGNLLLANFDLDCCKRSIAFTAAKETKYTSLNDSLKRLFDDAIDREKKAERKHNTAQKDLDVRGNKNKKTVQITKEYLAAQKLYEKNLIKLENQKGQIKFLKENVKNLTNENRNRVEILHNLTEEFYKLEKYLPNEENHGMLSKDDSLRAKLAVAEINRDNSQVEALIAKNKLKFNQQLLSEIQKKLVDIQNILEKHKQALQQRKNGRKLAEENLKKAHELRSDLLSEKEFLEEQKQLLHLRISEHEKKLDKIRKKTEALELTYKRQMTIKEYNIQRNNLKNCNLQHVANTVEAMLRIHDNIGNEIPIPTTSSSTHGSSETDNSTM